MTSNTYTKDEILQELASRGLFVDTYTLDTFFKIWKIDAIFENEKGEELFDSKAFNLVLTKLFNTEPTDLESGEDIENAQTNAIEEKTTENIQECGNENSSKNPSQSENTPLDDHFKNINSNDNKIKDEEINHDADLKADFDTTKEETFEVEQKYDEDAPSDLIDLDAQKDIGYKPAFDNEQKEDYFENTEENKNLAEEYAAKYAQISSEKNSSNPEDEKLEAFEAKVGNYDFSEVINEEKKDKEIKERKEQIKAAQARLNIQDRETEDVLSNITLSDGTPLIHELSLDGNVIENKLNYNSKNNPPNDIDLRQSIGGAQGDTMDTSINFENTDNSDDFDDLSLLSESIEAQTRLRDYIVSELSKKNYDVTPQQSNNARPDISEAMLNTIAQAMAKKIARHVSQICAHDAKAAIKLEEVKEINRKLERRMKELERQNKKLKLLLIETNKSLNSFKPSAFGLYKRVIQKNKNPQNSKQGK